VVFSRTFLFFCSAFTILTCCYAPALITIHTIYGSDIITEPVLIELLNSEAVDRLNRINQYGIIKFLKPDEH